MPHSSRVLTRTVQFLHIHTFNVFFILLLLVQSSPIAVRHFKVGAVQLQATPRPFAPVILSSPSTRWSAPIRPSVLAAGYIAASQPMLKSLSSLPLAGGTAVDNYLSGSGVSKNSLTSPPLSLAGASVTGIPSVSTQSKISGTTPLSLDACAAVAFAGSVSPRRQKASFTCVSPAAADSSLYAVGGKTEADEPPCATATPSPLAITLRSYLRCQMSLLSDVSPAFNNSSLIFLLRAADAHQRLLSPLELQTNRKHLPGATAARKMAAVEPEALAAANDEEASATEKQQPEAARSIRACETDEEAFKLELFQFEIRRLHRLLQFACAAQLRDSFLDGTATKVMLDLFQEADLPISSLFGALERLKAFYEQELTAADYETHFLPALQGLLNQMRQLQQEYDKEKAAGFTYMPAGIQDFYEPEPDERTLTPLLVDITQMEESLPGVAAWNQRRARS